MSSTASAAATIYNQPVVIDNGSGVLKAGVAGEDRPKVVFPSFVGTTKHVKCMAGALESDYYVGEEANGVRGLLKLQYAMEHGVVENWDAMDKIWNHAYERLGVQSDQHPVLLTEAPLNPRRNREKAAEAFFETFNVPALFISMQAVLSLYASGETTGVVVDCGDGVTHVVPICNGFAVANAIQRSDLAGRDVTRYLQLLLRKSGHVFHTSSEMEVVKSIKEECCFVALNAAEEEKKQASEKRQDSTIKYKLPDGNVIEVGKERFRAPEILFQPDLIGEEWPGVHELLHAAIRRVDLDLRKDLFGKIFISGGSTLFPGMGARLLHELQNTPGVPNDLHIRIHAPKERAATTWIGGSILANLPTFKKMWVSAAEYQEAGSNVIHRKCF